MDKLQMNSERVIALRQKAKDKIEARKKSKAFLKPPEPRYDDVYYEGITLMEEEARREYASGLLVILEYS